jgi:hypothetical protein
LCVRPGSCLDDLGNLTSLAIKAALGKQSLKPADLVRPW